MRITYERVYLTTPVDLTVSIQRTLEEKEYIQDLRDKTGGTLSGSQGIGDVEAHPRRLFVNPACDLLKYVRFFSAVKTHLEPKEKMRYYQPQVTLEIYIHEEDQPIVEMYPELCGLEGMSVYVYQS